MEEQEVTLSRELEFVSKYLDVMQARFDGRLDFRMEIDPRALGAYVPTMILQPLVENSIRHGLKPREGGGHIEISAKCEGETLHLSVADNGRGIERGDADRELDVEFALDVLAGPLFYRLLITGAPIDEGLARAVVDLILTGFAPAPRRSQAARRLAAAGLSAVDVSAVVPRRPR
jgi:hypothetical protein